MLTPEKLKEHIMQMASNDPDPGWAVAFALIHLTDVFCNEMQYVVQAIMNLEGR
jgi:hypothetical protein